MKFSIYRYHPEHDTAPSMQAMELDDALIKPGMMLLDALLLLKAQDESLTFRHQDSQNHGGQRIFFLPEKEA